MMFDIVQKNGELVFLLILGVLCSLPILKKVVTRAEKHSQAAAREESGLNNRSLSSVNDGNNERDSYSGKPEEAPQGPSSSDEKARHIARATSYRIEEECIEGKVRCSNLTERGKLWSHRASWHLPSAPREEKKNFDGADSVLQILSRYNIDPNRGFLPSVDPLQRLPYERYHLWEDLADDLPKLLGIMKQISSHRHKTEITNHDIFYRLNKRCASGQSERAT